MAEQKKCIKCGTLLNSKAVFCPNCGTKQTQTKPTNKKKPKIQVPVDTIDLKQIEENVKKNSSKRKKKVTKPTENAPEKQVVEDISVSQGLIHADEDNNNLKIDIKETTKEDRKEKNIEENVEQVKTPPKKTKESSKKDIGKSKTESEEITNTLQDSEDLSERTDVILKEEKEVEAADPIQTKEEVKKQVQEKILTEEPEEVPNKQPQEDEKDLAINDTIDEINEDPLMIFGMDDAAIIEEPEILDTEKEEIKPAVKADELIPHIELFGKDLDDYAMAELHKLSLNEKMETTLYPLITRATRGFRCIFLGARGTSKEDKFDEVAKLLYDIGKVETKECEYISFGEIPKVFNTKKVYVIDDLQSAITHLFNLEDFSENASEQQRHYQDLMEYLINASRNAYIFLNSNEAEIRGFITLDARLTFVFDNRVIFENLSNEEIYDKYKILIPDTHIGQINREFKDYFIGYLERNRRFFPFENAELSSFLASYSIREEKIKLPKEKFNPNTLEETFSQIIGMENVKSQVRELNQYLSIRQKLTEAGATLPDFNMHMMFLGNPGVGKTSIARIISKILFDLGYCREEKLVEVTSKDLVGAYGNQTGIKTNRAIMKALGGVLFVDEAYSLSNSCGQAGAEAIAIIIKAMMDYKNDLVVMFAGYSLEMRSFVESNSGISSRINYIFKFEDYSPEELFDIFMLKLGFCGMTLDPEAKVPVEKLCKFASGRRNAGNGRFIDNLIQKALTKHALLDLKGDDILVLNKKSIPTVEDIMATTFN